nr:hypothetical protein Itr_chr02CG18790 [Ipomoea trifida]
MQCVVKQNAYRRENETERGEREDDDNGARAYESESVCEKKYSNSRRTGEDPMTVATASFIEIPQEGLPKQKAFDEDTEFHHCNQQPRMVVALRTATLVFE